MARRAGAKGLAYITMPADPEGELRGPIGKFFSVDLKLELIEAIGRARWRFAALYVR